MVITHEGHHLRTDFLLLREHYFKLPEIFFQYPNPTRPEVEKLYPSDPGPGIYHRAFRNCGNGIPLKKIPQSCTVMR